MGGPGEPFTHPTGATGRQALVIYMNKIRMSVCLSVCVSVCQLAIYFQGS